MPPAPAIDRGVARIAARRLVETSLRPPGLPPPALLCIRRLADPLPGSLQLDVGALAPADDWRRAAADALATQAREAARPALGPVPAGAGAVLFADRAELLAALARDWLDGSLASRWWWAILLRTALPAELEVVRAWREEAAYAPAALDQLAATGDAAPFAARLAEPEALAIAAAVARAHGHVDVVRVLARMEAARRAPETVAVVSEESAADEQLRESAVWIRVVPEADAPLQPAARVFLAVALTAARAPAVARTRRFARAVERTLFTTHTSAPASVREALRAPRPRTSPPAMQRTAAPVRPAERRPTSEHAPAHEDEGPAAQRTEPDAAVAVTESRSPVTAAPTRQPRARQVRPPARTALRLPPEEREHEPLVAATRTELAGVFMLLNVALALELYSDFTLDVRRELAVDPWRLVSLAGAALLRGRRRRDPVWSLLDSLADERPARFPRDWRVPRAWLEPFGDEAELHHSTADSRLRVEHPAGFAIRDVPVARGAGECDWLGHFVAYLRARLALALAVPPARVARTLLQLPGRVYISSARVDVVMPLDELAIEVRLAGLDRDPGWIPRAGRDVRFHFE